MPAAAASECGSGCGRLNARGLAHVHIESRLFPNPYPSTTLWSRLLLDMALGKAMLPLKLTTIHIRRICVRQRLAMLDFSEWNASPLRHMKRLVTSRTTKSDCAITHKLARQEGILGKTEFEAG